MNESSTPQGQDNTANGASPTRRWWKRINWQLIVELLVLGVGIKVAYIYSGQLTQMVESNKLSRDSLVSMQRAFITSNGIKKKVIEVTNPAGVKKKAFEFSTQWENTGNTPAIGVVMSIGAVEQGYDLTEPQFMLTALTTEGLRSARYAIGPRSTISSGVVHQPEGFATDNPEVPRLFWGWLVYRDTFPNTKPHVTEFCLKTTKIQQDDGQYSFDATVCSHHNCVDEFCEDYGTITSLMSPN